MYLEFMGYIDEYFDDERSEALKNMYESFGKRLLLAPASSINYYHNAFPGGYIDHVLRVIKMSLKLYDFYEENEMSVQGFTKENLVFVAMNHDLGKLGFIGEGRERYLPNDSDWHVKNMGKVYKNNDKIPFSLVQDLSIYTLQKFKVTMNFEEYLSIKIHDGIYEEGNKPYFISRSKDSSLRTNLPYIIHQADLMASKHERKMWEMSQVQPSAPKSVLNELDKEKTTKEVKKEFEKLFE